MADLISVGITCYNSLATIKDQLKVLLIKTGEMLKSLL